METLHVDCGRCVVRGRACSDCVISVLLGVSDDAARTDVELVADEQTALAALAESGLLPPLRLVRSATVPETGLPPLPGLPTRRTAE